MNDKLNVLGLVLFNVELTPTFLLFVCVLYHYNYNHV